MASKQSFFNSTIGLKSVMAITGVLLLGFIVLHLLGNLQVFEGPEQLNSYAVFLRDLGPILWIARIGLLVIFLAHVISALQLRQRNAAARPVEYAVKRNIKTSTASSTMVETGIVILAFVALHLSHFTFGAVERGLPANYFSHLDAKGRHDVYRMVIVSFQNGYYSAIYIFCMSVLGLHLSHGIASFFQTLGFNHPKYSPCINRAAPLIAWVLALGYISIPVSVMFGLVY